MSIYDNPWVVHDHLPINQAFPALRSVCADPHIYLAEGFLSADECHGVIEAARYPRTFWPGSIAKLVLIPASTVSATK